MPGLRPADAGILTRPPQDIQMEDIDPDNPAWRYALRLYGRPGVAADCLRLQDEHGIDVSLLLVGLWLGQERGIALDAAGLGDAQAIARGWAEIAVAPLRAARRGVKLSPALRHPAVATFRAKLQAVEIEAERIEIALLHGWAERRAASGEGRDHADPAVLNLSLVLGAHGAGDAAVPALRAALADADRLDDQDGDR